jgi:gluconate transporter
VETLAPIAVAVLAVALLLGLILLARLPAFLALLVASLFAAAAGGLPPAEIAETLRQAMGATLGFIAVVIGVGALLGELLSRSGGARRIAEALVAALGAGRAPAALGIAGLLVAIPVFFDVAFIVFVPLVYGLARAAGRSHLELAFPLLAGLAVGHAFVPPTPGPVAVAGILGVELGWVIVFGLAAGVPALALGGLWFGRLAARRLTAARAGGSEPAGGTAPADGPPGAAGPPASPAAAPPSAGLALALLALPLLLIVAATAAGVLLDEGDPWRGALQFAGHPFTALIAATLLAWWLLGRRRGLPAAELGAASARALEPVGQIILVTGAGGVLGKVLVAIGVGDAVAGAVAGAGVPPMALAFLLAAAVRVAQGSATVAMVTAAGLLAPLVEARPVTAAGLAAITVAVAAGATVLSHVNDSGFWLVSRYLGLTEKETLRSWTVLTTVVGVTGFAAAWLLALALGAA